MFQKYPLDATAPVDGLRPLTFSLFALFEPDFGSGCGEESPVAWVLVGFGADAEEAENWPCAEAAGGVGGIVSCPTDRLGRTSPAARNDTRREIADIPQERKFMFISTDSIWLGFSPFKCRRKTRGVIVVVIDLAILFWPSSRNGAGSVRPTSAAIRQDNRLRRVKKSQVE